MIVGFSGYARTGKHEAARSLEPLGFKVVAFGDKLREILYTLNPAVWGHYDMPTQLRKVIDQYGWDGYKESGYAKDIRRLIQTLGTDCGRNLLGESIWIDATFKDDTENLAVADVRFPNEAQTIKDRGGMMIRVRKPGVGPANDHESETALDDWKFDWIIDNDGSVAELHYWTRYAVKHLTKDQFLVH